VATGGGRNWRLVRADRNAVPPSARRFMARARQRRLRAALPWAVGAGVLAVVGLLTWVVYGTAVLGVRTVRIEGTSVLTPSQVDDAAAVPMHEPLARVDLGAVRARVERLAPVDRAVVSRSWPGTIVVKVIERRPVAAVPVGQQFVIIDASGVPYRTVGRRPAGLPMAHVAQPGEHDLNTRSALIVLGALTPELRTQLISVTVTAPARISLELRKGRKVIWGDDTVSARKAQVATALLRQKGNTIDVSAPGVVTIS